MRVKFEDLSEQEIMELVHLGVNMAAKVQSDIADECFVYAELG